MKIVMKKVWIQSTLVNAYLEKFPPGTDGQEASSIPADEIIDIIYHSMQKM